MRSRRYFTGGIRQLIAELKEAFDQANVDITISSPAGLPKFASAIGIWQATSELRRKIEVGEVISRAQGLEFAYRVGGAKQGDETLIKVMRSTEGDRQGRMDSKAAIKTGMAMD
jgi:hypothetical protein